MDKDGKLIIKNDKGEILECEVLFTFDSDETGKSYICYTGESLKLEPITTDKEWKAINNILISVQEKVREVIDENGETEK